MTRMIGAMVAATTCVFATARAQELRITGSVVSSDGAPLSMAFVNLDSSKIICRVDSTGHYVLLVPASIAHGQPEKLQAMAQGHIHMMVPVTLAGTSIVRDFVLQVDTMPEHRRLHPTLSDGKTEKSETDITITGRVVDSAGEPISGAQLHLEPGGFAAATDESGRYTLIVPDRLDRMPVVISTRQIGLRQTSDTTLLTNQHVTHDFVLYKPTYGGVPAPLDSGIVRAAGLKDLRGGPHRKGEREIRIHIDGGYIYPLDLYVFRERDGKASGK
jgi:Carboxypeptidase regulatory-like domain